MRLCEYREFFTTDVPNSFCGLLYNRFRNVWEFVQKQHEHFELTVNTNIDIVSFLFVQLIVNLVGLDHARYTLLN